MRVKRKILHIMEIITSDEEKFANVSNSSNIETHYIIDPTHYVNRQTHYCIEHKHYFIGRDHYVIEKFFHYFIGRDNYVIEKIFIIASKNDIMSSKNFSLLHKKTLLQRKKI